MAEKKEDKVFTKLIDKHFSPLVIRKYTHWGFPIYIGMITDNDLSDFDKVVVEFMNDHAKEGRANNVQTLRNFAGPLIEYLNEY
jgi:hypothetical protein